MSDERVAELESSLEEERQRRLEAQQEAERAEEAQRQEQEQIREMEMARESRRRRVFMLAVVAMNIRLRNRGLIAKQRPMGQLGRFAIDIEPLNQPKDEKEKSFLTLENLESPKEILTKLKEKGASLTGDFKEKLLNAQKDMGTDFSLMEELEKLSKDINGKSSDKSRDKGKSMPKFSLQRATFKLSPILEERDRSRESRDFQREKPSVAGGIGGFK